jgi:phage-related protein
MQQFTDFYFNGEYSTVKGIFHASNADGMITENFLPSREVNQQYIKGKKKGYFQGMKRSPFSFVLNITSKEAWTRQKIDDIARWLDVEYYKEFYFIEEPNRRFFCMPMGEIEFTHNGINYGYITVEMTCNSPFAFSPKYQTGDYDYSNNTLSGLTLDFTNSGHFDLYPILRITKVGDGDISIVNETDDGRIFEIRNLFDGEEIFVDNQKKEIVSDITGVYRYDDHNGNWLKLIEGDNTLRTYGDCIISFEYRFNYSPVY